MVKRLVGYSEYLMAIAVLDRLLTNVTPSELAVMDDIVCEHDEYSIFTNLSRRLEQRPGTLSERGEHAGDNFQRRGLGWVLALARVEMGAMAAGFTEESLPFEKFGPTKLDLPQYREILEDSMRTHFWSLRNDPVTRDLRRGLTSDKQAIAYARRATLGIELINAVRTLDQKEIKKFSNEQRGELDKWEEQLTAMRRMIMLDILGVGSQQHVNNAPGGKTIDLPSATCDQRLLSAARTELSKGTAQVRKLPNSHGGAVAGKPTPPPGQSTSANPATPMAPTGGPRSPVASSGIRKL